MKYWITKYALTRGIYEVEGVVVGTLDIIPKVLKCVKKSGGPPEYYHKPYWYEDKARAIAHAGIQRKRKIDSLEVQLCKLKGLTFK